MQIQFYDIEGPARIEPRRIRDTRGFFMETFRDDWFRQNVADVAFVQDNHSLSAQVGTIRGLHYQSAPYAQGKIVRCLRGAIFDVAVDIRPQSPTFGKWVSEILTPENALQLWIPEGFAHGFCTLKPDTEVCYKTSELYRASHDCGIAFDDPDIGIVWPLDVSQATLSAKDREQPPLSSLR
ncbi:dTDP-4-dehydrorhamnose 3,5-epimerase [Asticcacaulis sp. W401b]|uniref:dTDP-4-dehydrorhamnose 3,5-epimerase n=1 Tax=Asticcacaulis sp. W401b TaxID=3388666 RepID=UPI0039710307